MTAWRAVAKRYRRLLHLDDPPWRIALALAVGVFISCTPFYFLQTVLALIVAFTFRLNKAATIAGTWLNLPWFQPFVYAGALRLGTLIVPAPGVASAETLRVLLSQPTAFSWPEIATIAKGLSIALLVGTTVVGGVAAAITYVVAVRVIARRRAHIERERARRRAA